MGGMCERAVALARRVFLGSQVLGLALDSVVFVGTPNSPGSATSTGELVLTVHGLAPGGVQGSCATS